MIAAGEQVATFAPPTLFKVDSMKWKSRIWLWPSIMLLILMALMFSPAPIPHGLIDAGTSEKEGGENFVATLSREEQNWLLAHPVVRVAQDPGWPPVEFVNDQGEASGMSADYLALIERRLGIRFERVYGLSWGEAYSQLKSWQIDMTTSVAVTPQRAEFWAFTEPYMSIPIVIATHLDAGYLADMKELEGKKVAVVQGYAVEDWIAGDFPGINLVRAKSTLDGLGMLQRGEVFAYIENLLVIGDYQAKMKITNIKIAGQTPYVNDQCMAVRKDWTPLAGILQKALVSIPESERNSIYRKWLPVRYEHGFDYALFWKVLAVFVVVVLAMLLWNRRLAREVESRKNAEVALRASEEEHRKYILGAPFGVVVTDERGRHLQANPSSCRITGYDSEELLAMNIADVFSAEGVAAGMAHLQQVLRQGEGQGEFLFRRKNGDKRWWSLTSVKISENRVLVFFDDITERKSAEEKILKANVLLNAVLEGTSDAIFVKDCECRYLLVNSGACSAIGRSVEEIVGKNDRQLFSPDSALVISDADQKVLVTGETVLAEERLETVDGITFWLAKKSPYFNEAGEIIGLIGISRDITPIKKNEDERKKLQVQLQQAQKLEAIGQLAGGIAHDFNNMLGVILGHAEMAMEDLDPAQSLYADLQEIRKAAERSANITRQLLAFARKQVVAPKIVDLNETVEGMLKMLRRLIGEDIELAWLPGSRLWSINMDPSQIDQILANLCVNARDAIGGVGKLIVETDCCIFDEEYCANHPGYLPGNYVKLTVADNGHGIVKENLPHIFEPFFTTKDVGEGTGLGLATVYGIVQQNKGFANVYSEIGQGTTFTLYLPAVVDQAEKMPMEKIAPVIGGNETILLDEDEPTIQKMTATMLQRLGYNVLVAPGPAVALDLCKTHAGAIHLLLTDVIMPQMNGWTLAEQLHAGRPEMKRIFMSGYTAKIIAGQGVVEEGVNFLQKPFSTRELAAKIREVLAS